MTTFFRPGPPPSPLRFWLTTLAIIATGLGLLFWLTGCASPGKAGFTQLKAQNVAEKRGNVAEKRVLKAMTVDTQNLGRHTQTALKLTDDLAHTKLDAAQTKELDEIRVELMGAYQDNNALTKKILELQDIVAQRDVIIAQRDATIAQTQAEVKAAERDSWWLKMKIRATWFAIGLVLGSVLIWIFRTAIHGAILAGAVYFPPLGRLAGK